MSDNSLKQDWQRIYDQLFEEITDLKGQVRGMDTENKKLKD